jgi:hypothetical protein
VGGGGWGLGPGVWGVGLGGGWGLGPGVWGWGGDATACQTLSLTATVGVAWVWCGCECGWVGGWGGGVVSLFCVSIGHTFVALLHKIKWYPTIWL